LEGVVPTDPEKVTAAPLEGNAFPETKSVSTSSELRYRRLFEAARDGILILEAETGTIVDANPFMCELLGYSHQDFLGKELWEIGVFEEQAASRAAYQTLREEGYIRYEHLPLRARDGKEVEVEFVSNIYLEGDSKVIQCNIRDITERRQLERQVQEQSEALADSNRRKDEFLAILSHELRNPLASILNAVQVFHLKKEEDPIQERAKAIVERQVGQLILLVDDLLEVTRISTGAVVLRLERCEVGEILRRAVEAMAHALAKQGHALSVTIPPTPIWLNADPGRIEQVLTNLLGNAIKYTDPCGRIEVSVQLEKGSGHSTRGSKGTAPPSSTSEAVFRVRDSGIGISPGLLPRVFELFTQADRSLVRAQGGLGLGLTIVQRLVKLHGGTVEAFSPGLGLGSEFVVRLPADVDPSPEVPDASELPTMRVLVVDDNVDYAEGLAMLLRASSYEVKVVHDGLDALQAAVDFQPNVVVLDIGLPGMDGYEVARRIRENPDLDGLRVVGVSGYRPEPEGKRSRDARFDCYLLKPVLLERLEACLRS
jgi:PAS domain S-box-containing protein